MTDVVLQLRNTYTGSAIPYQGIYISTGYENGNGAIINSARKFNALERSQYPARPVGTL